MLVTSTCGAVAVSTLGVVAPRSFRDRHADWRGADPTLSTAHSAALARHSFTEHPATAHGAAQRNPLVPRPRAKLG